MPRIYIVPTNRFWKRTNDPVEKKMGKDKQTIHRNANTKTLMRM